jgi:sec-independent protein translocase protein TatA
MTSTAAALGLIPNLGPTEFIVILVVALLFFGGRLPEVARSIGKSVNQFKKGLKDIENDVNSPEPPAPPKPKSLPHRVDAAGAMVPEPPPQKSAQG